MVTDQNGEVRVAFLVAVLLMIFVFSLTSNILVFVVFCRRPSLLNLSNRFVLNLAVSNFLLTVFVMPLVGWSTVERAWPMGEIACQVVGTVTTVLVAACIFTLMAIALDRYSAIMRPLHYDANLAAHKAVLLIGTIWLAAGIVAAPPLFGWNHIQFQTHKHLCMVHWHAADVADRFYVFSFVILCFLVPYFLMFFVYVTVFKAAQRTTALARRNSVTPEAGECIPPILSQAAQRRRSSVTSLLHVTRRRSSGSKNFLSSFHRDDWKAAKTAILVMSSFTVCWLPLFVLVGVEAALATDTAVPAFIQELAMWIALVSCALNPLIYVFRSAAIKQEIRCILCPGSRDNRRPSADQKEAVREALKEALQRRQSMSSECTNKLRVVDTDLAGAGVHIGRISPCSSSSSIPVEHTLLNGAARASSAVAFGSTMKSPGDSVSLWQMRTM